MTFSVLIFKVIVHHSLTLQYIHNYPQIILLQNILYIIIPQYFIKLTSFYIVNYNIDYLVLNHLIKLFLIPSMIHMYYLHYHVPLGMTTFSVEHYVYFSTVY